MANEVPPEPFTNPDNLLNDVYTELAAQQKIGETAKIITATVLGTAAELSSSAECESLWSRINVACKDAVGKKPEEAFATALFFIDLAPRPKDGIIDAEDARAIGWMQSSGFTILTFPEMRDRLRGYLDGPEGERLYQTLHQAMNFDTSGFTPERSWSEPRSFNKFAALAAGVNIRPGASDLRSTRLTEIARDLRWDFETRRQAFKVYATSSDCREMIYAIYPRVPLEWDRKDELMMEIDTDTRRLKEEGIAQIIVDDINSRGQAGRDKLDLSRPDVYIHVATHFSRGGDFRRRDPGEDEVCLYYISPGGEYVRARASSKCMANLDERQRSVIAEMFKNRGAVSWGDEEEALSREWRRRHSS